MKWMVKVLRKNKARGGFTLVELMIVVIVVGILAAASIPIYQRTMDKARGSEGKALLGTARTHYITEVAGGAAPAAGTTANDTLGDWGIDTTKNRWWIAEGADFSVDWSGYPTVLQISGAAGTLIEGIILAQDLDSGVLTTETYP